MISKHGNVFDLVQITDLIELSKMTNEQALDFLRLSPEWKIESRDIDNGVWYNATKDIWWRVGKAHTENGDF